MSSPVSHEFHRISVDKVLIPHDRQRREVGNVGEIAESIQRLGLINPITVTRDLRLVAGFTRLSAYQMLGRHEPANLKWKTISAQFVDELEPHQLKLIELEENIRRTDLTWQDESLAILSYYELRGEDYSVAQLAKDTGIGERNVFIRLQVARGIRSGDENVKAAGSLSAAYSVVQRKLNVAAEEETQRFLAAEATPSLQSILDGVPEIGQETPQDAPQSTIAIGQMSPPRPAPRRAPYEDLPDARVGDFKEFAQSYNGPLFHFVHCDFPYGVGHDTSDQGAATKHRTYSDSDSDYWSLVDALVDASPRLLAKNAHILFWFSMVNYTQTQKRFERAGFFVNPFPLIWYKSDRIGIVPDVKRRPRQVYETALLITKGDRPLIAPLPNCVAERANKRHAQHTSEKPEAMLRQFFKMLVDSQTRVFDPTCGSGSALSASIRLGAESVFGMDLDPANIRTATRLCTRARLQEAAGVELVDDEIGRDSDLDELGPTDDELEEIEGERLNLEDISVDDIDL